MGLFFFAVRNVNVISGFKYFLFNFFLANRGRWVGIMSFKAAALTHICGTYNHTCSTTFESNWGLDSNQDAKMLFFLKLFPVNPARVKSFNFSRISLLISLKTIDIL